MEKSVKMIKVISQIQKSLNCTTKALAIEEKSSVSSMTSAEKGRPPFNEPEEWQDTHLLSTLRWGTTQLTR